MERLNKYLARVGVLSRRQADLWILAGRVAINGTVVTEMGQKVDPARDKVFVDGKPVDPTEGFVYLILHKPTGYLTTVRDPFGRPIVMDLLPSMKARVYPVGRLDLDTSGLLFFTNDGEMALALTHPRHLVKKTYRVRVQGVPAAKELKSLEKGILLEDGITAPALVILEKTEKGNAVLKMTIREGRKRQIKRMLEAIGHPVLQLERLAMGPLTLGDLPPGRYRRPTETELDRLLRLKAAMKAGETDQVIDGGDQDDGKSENQI